MQENQSNITVRDAKYRVWSWYFFLFPLFVIRNVEKKLRRALKVEEPAI